MFARLIFAAVNFAARNGLSESRDKSNSTTKELARTTGIRGETFAYWYLRRQGYTLVARNYTVPGIKGEIDLIGYDGRALAFVEVKTRSTAHAQSTRRRSERRQTSQPRPHGPPVSSLPPDRFRQLPLRRAGHRIPRREKASRPPAQIRVRHGR
jgi:hypothetical protein